MSTKDSFKKKSLRLKFKGVIDLQLLITCRREFHNTSALIWQKHTIVFGTRATTAQLYPGRDTFEFDQSHVTKNQPITVLVLMSESLGIQHYKIID